MLVMDHPRDPGNSTKKAAKKGRRGTGGRAKDHIPRARRCHNHLGYKGLPMVRIGIVGVGFMGMIHYLAARKLKGARVTAICSRDPKKLAGDWRNIQGNFGPRGEMMDLSKIKKYDNF